MAYETRVDLYVCQTTWMVTMMLVALPTMVSVSAAVWSVWQGMPCVWMWIRWCQRWLRGPNTRPPPSFSTSYFSLTVSLWRLPIMVGMHDDLAFRKYTAMMRGDTVLFSPDDSHMRGKLLTSDSYVTHLGASWWRQVWVGAVARACADPIHTSDNLYKVNIS